MNLDLSQFDELSDGHPSVRALLEEVKRLREHLDVMTRTNIVDAYRECLGGRCVPDEVYEAEKSRIWLFEKQADLSRAEESYKEHISVMKKTLLKLGWAEREIKQVFP